MPRAPVFYEFGDPADVLKIENLPLREPGPGQVRISVKAFALNRADLLFIHGEHYSLCIYETR